MVGEPEVIALPGHSAGQIGLAFSLADGRTAWIAGDVAMNLVGLREPILYEDRAEGLASIRTLTDRLRDGDLLCLGHGRPITVGEAARRRLRVLGVPPIREKVAGPGTRRSSSDEVA
ncbi:hypothetical protein jaqu_16390 [Jannaschia aquimarina]|uniref:MBL fold metallo-hydrolase n=1 Tax=Jannaschia aquimarina TaxID=935700 RepID=A0A0D1ELG2_9RHOB|nr:hypothetical protein jaqu_16390 [Jannaschia aquimarina]SNT42642.1 hypothetical protein SAMN05421775_12013 [Jannaschia aquimarina]